MVTLALIGAGKWGQNYLRTATSLYNVEIKYIYAQSQQSLNSLPDTYVKTLSLTNLLKNKQIDGFIIATPAYTHFTIAKQLLSLGKNLLIEKPLTTNYQQALELQKIWQIKKPQVLVDHSYLYNPAYRVFKRLFKGMKKIRSIHFEGLNSPIRKDVSVIWDWGPHPISLLLDLIQHTIAKVSATGSYHTVNAKLQFSNGIEASFNISWLGPYKIRKITAESNDLKIELDDTNTTSQKVIMQKLNMLPQYPKYNSEKPLTIRLAEFAAAIQDNKQITSDINMGVKVVKVLSAIEQSVENNGQLIVFSKQSRWP